MFNKLKNRVSELEIEVKCLKKFREQSLCDHPVIEFVKCKYINLVTGEIDYYSKCVLCNKIIDRWDDHESFLKAKIKHIESQLKNEKSKMNKEKS